jgi:hypothetical protein
MPRMRSTLPALLMGLLIGAAIWWLSPLITGRLEPWDAGSGYYEGALLGAGILGGLLLPKHWRWFVIGVFLGQVLVLLGGVLREPSSGGLWPLGVVFMALYSLLAMVGAMVGSGVRRRLSGRTP